MTKKIANIAKNIITQYLLDRRAFTATPNGTLSSTFSASPDGLSSTRSFVEKTEISTAITIKTETKLTVKVKACCVI